MRAAKIDLEVKQMTDAAYERAKQDLLTKKTLERTSFIGRKPVGI
jgi:hypothetical protein